MQDGLRAFLGQAQKEVVPLDQSIAALEALMGDAG
jgi:hypothetical protein